jgi:hypothetical protein
MCFLLLFSSELLFNGCLKGLLVVGLSSQEIGSRSFEVLSDLLSQVLVVTGLFVGL